jgi:hypothetical protein
VQSRGFFGEGWAWVEAVSLRAFIDKLRELETHRQGSAELESMSPGQFRLRIWATDTAGHIAVAGRLKNDDQALEFQFALCPTLLPQVIAGFEAMTDQLAQKGESIQDRDQPGCKA